MDSTRKMKDWKFFGYALFLGPFFLIHHFWSTRRSHTAVTVFAWSACLLLGLCAWLMFTYTGSPFIVRIVYCFVFLSIVGLCFMYGWVTDSKKENPAPDAVYQYSMSGAVAWMVMMGILLFGCNNLVQAFYYWVFGEQVTVYFSGSSNVFVFWLVIGLIYGFVYGLHENNSYITKTLMTVFKSIVFIILFVFLMNGLILLLGVYPVQRLSPLSYQPQIADYLFYFMLFMAMVLGLIYLMQTVHRTGYMKSSLNFIIGAVLIAFHAIVVSAYTTTINLTIASILEDRGDLSSAKKLYTKSIPYISYDHLLASLHHRQGVLHVLNKDYDDALISFKRVIADYSASYDAYRKSLKYVDSYEQNDKAKDFGNKVLSVRHQTFEQAASCFPNSLSVILKFYEENPVSTRALSYAIKEGFSSGTFIWKAESFLSKNNYELITTFWQDKTMLIDLLEAGYPVLLYMPGHVYTLYGYDNRTGMFFTYDTAKSNRWSDKPFENLLKDWMKRSFSMSVVVPRADVQTFTKKFPDLFKHSDAFKVWQRSQISDYYTYKNNYWKDYDPYKVSKNLGNDRLIIGDRNLLSEDFYPYLWDSEEWKMDLLPILENEWALDWQMIKRFVSYLIKSGKAEVAFDLIQQYQARLAEEQRNSFPRLLELKLSAAIAAGRDSDVLSLTEKLIAISDREDSVSTWGHYLKARTFMNTGDFKAAAELLLPVLNTIYLDYSPEDPAMKYIVDLLVEIRKADDTLIDSDKGALIDVVRVFYSRS